MRFVLVAGTTETAAISGLSAAGADPTLMEHTPAADAEILEFGETVYTPETPVSPTGCPTPAVITRAVRELVNFDLVVIDAGLTTETAVPTVSFADTGGEDIRDEVAVPDAQAIVDRARRFSESIPDDHLIIGETIPGGTTTALGVLTALGKSYNVSSSLPENPHALKESVVQTGLVRSGMYPGDASGDPLQAVRCMGDPVLAGISGLVMGALHRDIAITLAGGTQMIAVAALVRHWGYQEPFEISTTSFIKQDEPSIETAAADLNLSLHVTDPAFDVSDHQALSGYVNGEGKEGVGMGGALWLAKEAGISMDALREHSITCYERMVEKDGS